MRNGGSAATSTRCAVYHGRAGVGSLHGSLAAAVLRKADDDDDGDETFPLDLEKFLPRLMQGKVLFR